MSRRGVRWRLSSTCILDLIFLHISLTISLGDQFPIFASVGPSPSKFSHSPIIATSPFLGPVLNYWVLSSPFPSLLSRFQCEDVPIFVVVVYLRYSSPDRVPKLLLSFSVPGITHTTSFALSVLALKYFPKVVPQFFICIQFYVPYVSCFPLDLSYKNSGIVFEDYDGFQSIVGGHTELLQTISYNSWSRCFWI